VTLLRRGYITRYLCERLAYGLAPETVDAFFVQR
jgi:cellulose synthase (UDP-forming)